jgi:hypothetical protein
VKPGGASEVQPTSFITEIIRAKMEADNDRKALLFWLIILNPPFF